MKIKKLLSMGLVAAMTITMAGCSGGAGKQNTSTAAPGESATAPGQAEVAQASEESADPDVTLTVWEFSKWNGVTGTETDGKPGDWMNAMAENFSTNYPNVTINVEVFDFQSGPNKANTALQAGQYPALIHDTDTRLLDYANRGFLMPISDYIDQDVMNQFNDGAFDIATISDKKAYYIPFGGAPAMMMVNKSLFEKAGTLDLLPQNEERTWTFDEYYNAIKTTQDKLSGVYGTANTGVFSTGDAFTTQWVWGAGGSLFSDTLDKVVINEPNSIKGLAFWRKLIDDGLQAPGGATTAIGDLYPLFNQQIVLSVMCATTQYARTKLAMASGDCETFDIMLTMPPTIDGNPVTSSFPHGFAVPVQDDPLVSKYAGLFANYLSSPENASAVIAASEFSYQKGMETMYDESVDDNMIFAATAMKYIRPSGTAAIGFNALRNGLTPELQKLYAGDITVEDFCTYAETEGNKILAQARADLGK